ncbi:MAG: hypothetical protein ACOVT5_16825, partial [Armatimonadaceae bacterium]
MRMRPRRFKLIGALLRCAPFLVSAGWIRVLFPGNEFPVLVAFGRSSCGRIVGALRAFPFVQALKYPSRGLRP